MVHVHTDRLLLNDIEDEEELLAQTPHVVAIIPRFVDHAPAAICHTLIFRPSPETVCYTNETLHEALRPPHLLAALPPPTYLATATTAPNHPPPADPSPDVLDSIFSQWSTPPTTEPDDTTAPPSRKRACANPGSNSDNSTNNDDASTNSNTDLNPTDDDDDGDDHSTNADQSTAASTHHTAASTHMAEDPDDDPDDDAEDHSDDDSTSMADEHHIAESDTLLSTSTPDYDEIEHSLSQTAAAEFKTIEFDVEAHHPNRFLDFQILLKHA
jgi:hypothetical protein